MRFGERMMVRPGSRVKLGEIDPGETFGVTDKAEADRERVRNVERLAELQELLWADNRFSLLVVLQGMDTSGKDGTIRRVLSGINPQGCRVVSFGRPTAEELEHDYLWRIHKECPRRGEIGVFNRSHYEDIGIVRVHKIIDETTCRARYGHINGFERHLSENGTTIVKFFLHISKEEQKERLEARLRDPTKNWKMNPADLEERKVWDGYQRAYEEAIGACSTAAAPWYVVPADKKWFRNLAVSSVLVEVLEGMGLAWPEAGEGVLGLKVGE